MNEQLLKMNGLSLDILDALSFESHLGIPLKKNLHYFDKTLLIQELFEMTEWLDAQELLSEIATVLDVNINSLRNPSLENTETFIHMLFNLEQESKKHHTNNFSIISVPDELGNSQPSLQFHNHLLNEFLSEWQLRRKELSEEIITEEEYAEWMMNFPATSDGCGKNEPIKKWRK